MGQAKQRKKQMGDAYGNVDNLWYNNNAKKREDRAMFDIGFDYYDQGINTKAVIYFDKAIELNSNFAEAYYYRAECLFENGEDCELSYEEKREMLHQALADFDKAIEIDPNLAIAYNGRSYLKSTLGDEEGAQKDREHYLQQKSRRHSPMPKFGV